VLLPACAQTQGDVQELCNAIMHDAEWVPEHAGWSQLQVMARQAAAEHFKPGDV
jgi:hypothetical protein